MEELLNRIENAISAMEAAVERLNEGRVAMSAEAAECVGQIVATVESQREQELVQRLEATEAKLGAAEARIAELASGRKTVSAGEVSTRAKQIDANGQDGLDGSRLQAGALDAALGSLSIEQRFAVKAEMMRAGLLG